MEKRVDAVTKWAVGLALFASTCGSCGHPGEPLPLSVARINPAPVWQMWAQRAIDCAVQLRLHADTGTFTVVHDSVDIQNFVWIAVLTERGDGGFPCRVEGKSSFCDGQFRAPDSLLISSQRLNYEPVIAHEVLHWAVDNPHEDDAVHGAPWGICEFY